METYLYLTLMPQALVASMLPPEKFGNYMAVGTKKRTRGQAMFFEVDPNFESDYFPLSEIEKRCVPHPDGNPKCSVYLAIYRVLVNVPMSQLKQLYLVTDDGRVLGLDRKEYTPPKTRELHLYQQIAPVNPRIASNLNPLEFCKFVTDMSHPVSVPRLVFTELIINELATDPIKGSDDDLPYANIDHLRDCLVGLQEHPEKPTKTVIRYLRGEILYRTIKNGFFIGDQKDFFYYPMPSMEELESTYFTWWRSALTVGFD